MFWQALVDQKHLDPKDYTIINVDAPEMVAALGRGDIDAYSVWEPWLTRGVAAVPGARLVINNVGIIEDRVFIYANKGWAEKNHEPAVAFVRSLVQATAKINDDRDGAAADVAKFLKMDVPFAKSLMAKLRFGIKLDQHSIENFQITEQQLKTVGKLRKPVDWSTLFYPDLLREVAPEAVNYKLP